VQATAGIKTVTWTSIHDKKQKFSCVLYPHSQFLCSLAKFDLANQGENAEKFIKDLKGVRLNGRT